MKNHCHRAAQIALASVMFTGSAEVSNGATLQLDGPAGGDWDETQATQTGNVGGVDVEITISALHWTDTFQDDASPYASSFFGPLAQPTSFGDFMVIQTAPSFDVFTVTITLQDTLDDPIIYLSDVDWTNAEIGFEPGADQTYATNGSFAGDIFTSDGTSPGGWAAALYSGTFAPGSTFEISFDYSNVTIVGSELVGLGIGTPVVVPAPATGWLLVPAVAAAARYARRRGRAS